MEANEVRRKLALRRSMCELCRGGAVASWLVRSVSQSSGPGYGRVPCVVFLGKTLYSHSASLHPGDKWLLTNVMLGVSRDTPGRFTPLKSGQASA